MHKKKFGVYSARHHGLNVLRLALIQVAYIERKHAEGRAL
jgi:hypothetical protein